MIRTDDNAPMHSKFQQAGLSAYGWWHAALSYCGRQLTDGFIATRSLGVVFPATTEEERMAAIEALIREGCLHKLEAGQRSPCGTRVRGQDGRLYYPCPRRPARESGYVLHDYLAFQKSRSEATVLRHQRAAAGRKGGEKSWETRKQVAEPSAEGGAEPRTDPIRTVPIRTDPEKQDKPSARRARAPRLADAEFIASLKPNYPGIDVDREVGKLRAWLLTPRGRNKQFTRQRLVGWLNGADAPLSNGTKPRDVNDPWQGQEPGELKLR